MLHLRCTGDARWIAERGSDDRPGTGIRAPSAGPVRMHVWAVDGGRRARPSAADVVPSDSTVVDIVHSCHEVERALLVMVF